MNICRNCKHVTEFDRKHLNPVLWECNNPAFARDARVDPVGGRSVVTPSFCSTLNNDGNCIGYEQIPAFVRMCGSDWAPVGWTCTREAGHDGPCAAVKLHEPWYFKLFDWLFHAA
jgi:hypothetical protein